MSWESVGIAVFFEEITLGEEIRMMHGAARPVSCRPMHHPSKIVSPKGHHPCSSAIFSVSAVCAARHASSSSLAYHVMSCPCIALRVMVPYDVCQFGQRVPGMPFYLLRRCRHGSELLRASFQPFKLGIARTLFAFIFRLMCSTGIIRNRLHFYIFCIFDSCVSLILLNFAGKEMKICLSTY